MVWGFWHKEFGKRNDERDTLVNALRTFGRIREFDRKQKERYIAQQFPEVWRRARSLVSVCADGGCSAIALLGKSFRRPSL
jgi:ribosomal protein L32E